MSQRWASFDCYGTLIDWEAGITATFARIWPDHDPAALLQRHHAIEPVVQRGSAVPYREVLALTVSALAQAEGLELSDPYALSRSLPSWPPFTEVPQELAAIRERGWRLAILSNTDPDLLEASVRSIGVEVDLRITAAEARSYKPAHGHWDRFRERSGADPQRHVHVGASVFHDIEPAAGLAIPAVWINRAGAESTVHRAAELPTLRGLADVLDRLVGA